MKYECNIITNSGIVTTFFRSTLSGVLSRLHSLLDEDAPNEMDDVAEIQIKEVSL